MQQAAFAEQPPQSEPTTLRLECSATAKELAPIVAVNALLTIVTLGVYRFWAKTRVRRYLWSRTNLLGDAFEYTGTGGELFRGFLIVLFCVLLPLFAYNWAVSLLIDPERVWLQLAAMAPFYAAILFLIGAAAHRARRYRFSRTSWRGVRAAQQGSAARFGAKYLGFMLLNVPTLGWAYPWMNVRLSEALTNDSWFGDRRFTMRGSPEPLYGTFAVAWLAAAVSFALVVIVIFVVAAETGMEPPLAAELTPLAGVLLFLIACFIAFAWYGANEAVYLAACTRYEGLQARYDVTAGALLWLSISNMLLLIVTLGLGGAFVELRNLRFVCTRLSFAGEIDVASIMQSLAAKPSRGEGLAEAFDVGAM